MRAYYGSKISENMTVTPEGFLICLSVPIARTGVQEYLPHEIGAEGDQPLRVTRRPEDVFSASTLASFEGKPVTYDHPPMALEPNNASAYVKGHAQNIRRGTGIEEDLVLSDLFITDPELIRLIRHADVREISCGYECEYTYSTDGQIYQRSIRGNHIAVVASGRAGVRVAIKDTQIRKNQGGKHKMNRKSKNTLFSRMFAGWAKDAQPDEVAAALDELVEQTRSEEGELPGEHELAQALETQMADSPRLLMQLLAAVQALNAKLEAIEQNAGIPTDPIAQLERELQTLPESESGLDAEETLVISPINAQNLEQDGEVLETQEERAFLFEKTSENQTSTADRKALLAAVRAIKPIIAQLPPRERRMASDMAARKIRQAAGKSAFTATNGYRAINESRDHVAAKRNMAADDAQLGQDIMEKYNPHYKTKP